MIELRYQARSRAGVSTVWAVLEDHAHMDEWMSRVWRSRLIEPGRDDPNGVGAVRALWSVGGPIRERVVSSEPPRRLEYEMIRGNPLVGELRGTVLLAASPNGGTDIDWRLGIVARPQAVEPALRKVASFGSAGFATDLARAAERSQAGTPESG